MRELNQQTAKVMARVERGETIEITRQGRVIGRIVPPLVNDAPAELLDLIASGRVTPPTIHGPIPMPAGEVDHTSAATRALLQMRDEERC